MRLYILKNNTIARIILLTLVLSIFHLSTAFSQKKRKNKKITPKQENIKKGDNFSSITKKCTKYDGLFTIYQDSTNGKLYIALDKEQLDKEFIYFSHIVDGVLDAGRNIRGGYRGSKIFTINKHFDKVEFSIINTSYYFDKNNALSKAAHANINRPIIYTKKVTATNKNYLLIEADDLFLTENFHQLKPSPNPIKDKESFTLGNLSKEKTKCLSIKNYPENTDITVEYVYEKLYPSNNGSKAITDPRFTSIKLQHSIIEVPENDYSPRHDDPRVGYFSTQSTDMTSTSATPYQDFIRRWNLKKKDPSAPISEPVEPIVWWIENTTPKEFRNTIKEGVLRWNKAFEKAGFKNAIVVKEQPDSASWDAGDIRYNVIRWVSSPNPAYGGYGPSFSNPRTGQILGADIILEYVYFTNRVKYDKLFSTTALDFLRYPQNEDISSCNFSETLHYNTLFGLYVLQALNLSDIEKKELIKQALYMLALHEVGHTLGLTHNMKASYFHDADQIFDKKLTLTQGLTTSVMDYIPVNITSNEDQKGHYYNVNPGPYDIWAIQYGYTTDESEIPNLLKRSTENSLAFGNDADDMRSAGKAIDPRVMVSDMSSDPITYSINRIKLINKTLPKIKEKYTENDKSYQELSNAFLILTREYAVATRVLTRQIAGIYVDRSFPGQPNHQKPFIPVSYATQKKAMQVLQIYAFGPEAFYFPQDLYNYVQQQRRGFDFMKKTEDPKLHDRVLAIQKDLLNHLLHPTVLTRMIDSKMYGNEYNIAEFMTDLTNAIFKEDINKSVSSIRQNLQLEYINRLILIIAKQSNYNNIAQSMALFELNRVKKMVANTISPNTITKAHKNNVIFKINKALETK